MTRRMDHGANRAPAPGRCWAMRCGVPMRWAARPASPWPAATRRWMPVLPGGGWPLDAVGEVLQPHGLHAEWRLLLPALLRLQRPGAGAVVLVGPPHLPFGPALPGPGPAVRARCCVSRWPSHRDGCGRLNRRCAALACRRCWPGCPGARRAPAPLASGRANLRQAAVCAAAVTGAGRVLAGGAAPAAGLADGRTGWLSARRRRVVVHLLKRRGPPLAQPLWLPARQGQLSAGLVPRAPAVVARQRRSIVRRGGPCTGSPCSPCLRS